MFENLHYQPPNKLGELLVKANLVPSGDIVEALTVSRKLRIPMGRVLIAAECINQRILDTALQAQASIKAGLNGGTASDALQLAIEKNISFGEARKLVEESAEQTSPAPESRHFRS